MADLTNGIDQQNVGPPIGPPALSEFLVGRPPEQGNDWWTSAVAGQVSFSQVSVSPSRVSIASMAVPMTNVVSGQPIVIMVTGEATTKITTVALSDNFAVRYTYNQIGPTQWINNSGQFLFQQLWIATGGQGDHGVITVSGLTNSATIAWSAMAYSAINASTAAGLSAVDTFAYSIIGFPSLISVTVTPSLNGGGALGFVASYLEANNPPTPISPANVPQDALPTAVFPGLRHPGLAVAMPNTQSGTPLVFSWAVDGNGSTAAAAVVLLPAGYSSTSVGVEPSSQIGIPSETLPPIGPPPLTAMLFQPPMPTEMGPSAPAHVPNTASSVELYDGPPVGEIFPPIGPPPLTAFLFGRDPGNYGDGGASSIITYPGTGSGSLDIEGSAVASAYNPATGAGSLDIEGSAVGVVTYFPTGSGSLDIEGSATGVANLPATGSGSLDIEGSGTGSAFLPSTGSGSFVINGSGTGSAFLPATGSGALAINGSGTGSSFLPSTASGSLSINGSATGVVTYAATGLGSLSISGSGAGVTAGQDSSVQFFEGPPASEMLPPIGPPPLTAFIMGRNTQKGDSGVPFLTGQGAGSLSISGSATATVYLPGTGSGAVSISGSGTATAYLPSTGSGSVSINGTGTATTFLPAQCQGSLSISGTATGQITYPATGSGSVSISGVANGVEINFLSATGHGSLSISGSLVVLPASVTGSLAVGTVRGSATTGTVSGSTEVETVRGSTKVESLSGGYQTGTVRGKWES